MREKTAYDDTLRRCVFIPTRYPRGHPRFCPSPLGKRGLGSADHTAEAVVRVRVRCPAGPPKHLAHHRWRIASEGRPIVLSFLSWAYAFSRDSTAVAEVSGPKGTVNIESLRRLNSNTTRQATSSQGLGTLRHRKQAIYTAGGRPIGRKPTMPLIQDCA